MTIFPLFGILIQLFADNDAVVRRKHRAPSFDRSGVEYHEPLVRIISPDVNVADMSWWLPWTNGDSLQFVVKNHVKTMHCLTYEPDDTVKYYSDYWKKDITEYHIGGLHKNLCWNFDSSGRLTSFVCYNDTAETSIRTSQHFTYDNDGYLTSSSIYSLEDGISKQYRGFTYRMKIKYRWSDDHRVCDVDFDSKLVSLPGTSRRNRKLWDNHSRFDEHWEFNANQKPMYFKGDYFGHNCEMNYSYNDQGDICLRTVNILDKCGGGFTDSIAWSYVDGRHFAQHYFALNKDNKKGAYVFLEIVSFSPGGQLLMAELGDSVEFPDDEFDNLRGGKFVAIYEGDQIVQQEERDSLQNFIVKMTWDYSRFNDQTITTTTWLEQDTFHIDTIRVVKTYSTDNGLITAIDVHNRDFIYWKGTWFFPEYVDLDDFECYRFRYEYY